MCIGITSIRNDNDVARPDCAVGKDKQQYHMGLLDEHYVAIDKRTYYIIMFTTLRCEVKYVNNANKVVGKTTTSEYKLSNDQCIETQKWIDTLIQNGDTWLEPKPLDEALTNGQLYEKIKEFKTLEYPPSCIKYNEHVIPYKTIYHKLYVAFETTTDGDIHEPYLCRS